MTEEENYISAKHIIARLEGKNEVLIRENEKLRREILNVREQHGKDLSEQRSQLIALSDMQGKFLRTKQKFKELQLAYERYKKEHQAVLDHEDLYVNALKKAGWALVETFEGTAAFPLPVADLAVSTAIQDLKVALAGMAQAPNEGTKRLSGKIDQLSQHILSNSHTPAVASELSQPGDEIVWKGIVGSTLQQAILDFMGSRPVSIDDFIKKFTSEYKGQSDTAIHSELLRLLGISRVRIGDDRRLVRCFQKEDF